MASVTIATPLTGVAIGGKNDFKTQAVRHWISKVHDVSEVTTVCGAKITALPATWQQTRPCQRCPQSGNGKTRPEAVSTTVGWHFVERQHDFYGEWEKRRLLHALLTIKTCGSKRLARQIAMALGYENPELIKYDYPEVGAYVTYIRKPKNLR